MAEDIYLAGISMTPFGVFQDLSVKQLAHKAVQEALRDASAKIEDIGAAFFSNAAQDLLEGQNAVAGQIALRSYGFERIPMFNIENACASGGSAVNMAVNYVRAGVTDVALAIGVEKMNYPDMGKVLNIFEGGYDVHDPESLNRILKELGGDDFESGDGHRSAFMEVYASTARAHMRDFGTTQQQLAVISSKNHKHSTFNPLAHFKKEFSVEEILEARPLSFPLTVPMCAPMTDGAAAAIVCSSEGLKRLKAARPIKILSSCIGTGSNRPLSAWDRSVTRFTAQSAYEEAGIGPEDISVAEVHDASAFGEVLQTESLGFCEVGAGGQFAESGETALGGKIPINPSGGLESKGHPIGATGIGQMYELATQLRGEAGKRQVEGARLAICENGGGMFGGEEAVVSITILGK